MDIRTIMEIGVVVFGAIGSWFILKAQVDRLKEEDIRQWEAITKLRDWSSLHEKDSSQTRLDLEKSMGQIRETASKNDGKIDTLIAMIADLSDKLDKMEVKFDKLRGN